MRVLGLETSGEWGGIALCDDSGLVAELAFRHELQLSRLLTSRIRETLTVAGWGPLDLAGVAVSLGPGSFTGLRIGVTEAKSLAFALGIPVVGVGTLEALADEHPSAATVALIAASATELFGVVCENGRRVGEERLASADVWQREIADLNQPRVVGALGRHREGFSPDLRPAVEALPRAATVARLGRARLLGGEVGPTHALVPRYLRLSTPEVRKIEAAARETK